MLFRPLDAPSWSIEGRNWPNREASRFVSAGGLSWHVQEWDRSAAGRPKLLLLHGTGAATHSFRDLAPRLARDCHILALDLPGHGFTATPSTDGLSLPGMARLVGGLLDALDFQPEIVVGHSAGAAILASMALDGLIAPKAIVALNGALRPIRGAAVFSPLAKLLFLNPFAPRIFARRAMDRDATRRLLEGTGSRLDADGIDLYARLFRRSGHIAATLGMMAHWDLERLERRLPRLAVPLVLVTAAGDKAVPPRDAAEVAARIPSARVVSLKDGGHLVHEERPDEIARVILGIAAEEGVAAGDARPAASFSASSAAS